MAWDYLTIRNAPRVRSTVKLNAALLNKKISSSEHRIKPGFRALPGECQCRLGAGAAASGRPLGGRGVAANPANSAIPENQLFGLFLFRQRKTFRLTVVMTSVKSCPDAEVSMDEF